MQIRTVMFSLCALAAVMAAGWFSRKRAFFRREHTQVLSGFVYNFGLPALFIAKISALDFFRLDWFLVTGSVLPIALIVAVLVCLGLARVISKDTFVILGIMVSFGSNAFFGIPFFTSLFGDWGQEYAVVAAAVLGMLGIFISVALFEYAVHRGKSFHFLLRVLRSPLVLSTITGALLSLLKIRHPLLSDAVRILGDTAIGTAIFVLGMFIYDHGSVLSLRQSLGYSMARILLLPAVTLAVLMIFGRGGNQLNAFLLIQAGIPAAISIAIMAERYQYRISELTGAVILTSLGSFVTLGVLSVAARLFFGA